MMYVVPCHLCGKESIKLIEAYTELPRVTSDSKAWAAGGVLAVCQFCGTVFKPVTPAFEQEIQTIYDEYTIYHQSAGKEQAIFGADGVGQQRSSRLIGKWLEHIDLPAVGRMLDIGCGVGSTLAAFGRACPKWTLAGTEITPNTQAVVEALPNVEAMYVTDDLQQVPGRFDLISMVHVMEHVTTPDILLQQIQTKLNPDGILVIEVPNYRDNPFDLLIADHANHFSTDTLAALLQRNGYAVIAQSDRWLPKEVSVIARYTGQPTHAVYEPPQAYIEQLVAWLKAIPDVFQPEPETPTGILGTANAGTWLHSILNDKITFFVDEDPNRVGREYLSKPILHPNQVPDDAHVLVPMAHQVARSIQDRFAQAHYTFTIHTPPPEPTA